MNYFRVKWSLYGHVQIIAIDVEIELPLCTFLVMGIPTPTSNMMLQTMYVLFSPPCYVYCLAYKNTSQPSHTLLLITGHGSKKMYNNGVCYFESFFNFCISIFGWRYDDHETASVPKNTTVVLLFSSRRCHYLIVKGIKSLVRVVFEVIGRHRVHTRIGH